MKIRIEHEIKGAHPLFYKLWHFGCTACGQAGILPSQPAGCAKCQGVYPKRQCRRVLYGPAHRAAAGRMPLFPAGRGGARPCAGAHQPRAERGLSRKTGGPCGGAAGVSASGPGAAARRARLRAGPGYVRAGLRCLRRGRLEVPVLDAAAITVSLARRDFPPPPQ